MVLLEAISARNVATGRTGLPCPAVISLPSCACVNVDCRSSNSSSVRNEWTALSLDNGRTIGISGRKGLLARRGPCPPRGLESKRSVQQEEKKDDSEGSPGISSAGDGDSGGEVVEGEFEAEASDGPRTEEKLSTAASVDDIGKALSELRKERIASGVQDPASTSDFWQGVAEETKLIEWPALPKVLGTTGVVVAMILGSSVVLLTVNAVLAEGSDFLFSNPAFKEFARGTLNLYW